MFNVAVLLLIAISRMEGEYNSVTVYPSMMACEIDREREIQEALRYWGPYVAVGGICVEVPMVIGRSV